MNKKTTELVLKRGSVKPTAWGHPWVFARAMSRLKGEAAAGDVVRVVDEAGNFFGLAFYNPSSAVVARIVSRADRLINGEFFREKIRAAVSFRKKIIDSDKTDAYRLINSEGDGLPGLVVDRYGPALCAQFHSAAFARRIEELADILMEETGADLVIDAGDPNICKREKIPAPAGRQVIVGDSSAAPSSYRENGHTFVLNLFGSQKTGAYLDQRENRRRLGLYAGRRIFDACCYTGGFSVNSWNADVERLVLVDSSRRALKAAEKNLAAAGAPGEMPELVRGDARKVMAQFAEAGERFDTVIIDPPKLAPTRASLRKAEKVYAEYNRLGIRLVSPGGVLLTCSCSFHMDEQSFRRLAAKAAMDVNRSVSLLEVRGAGPDHPVPPSFDEGRYLKALFLRVE